MLSTINTTPTILLYTQEQFEVGDKVFYNMFSRKGEYCGREKATIVKFTKHRVTISIEGTGILRTVKSRNLDPRPSTLKG